MSIKNKLPLLEHLQDVDCSWYEIVNIIGRLEEREDRVFRDAFFADVAGQKIDFTNAV